MKTRAFDSKDVNRFLAGEEVKVQSLQGVGILVGFGISQGERYFQVLVDGREKTVSDLRIIEEPVTKYRPFTAETFIPFQDKWIVRKSTGWRSRPFVVSDEGITTSTGFQSWDTLLKEFVFFGTDVPVAESYEE